MLWNKKMWLLSKGAYTPKCGCCFWVLLQKMDIFDEINGKCMENNKRLHKVTWVFKMKANNAHKDKRVEQFKHGIFHFFAFFCTFERFLNNQKKKKKKEKPFICFELWIKTSKRWQILGLNEKKGEQQNISPIWWISLKRNKINIYLESNDTVLSLRYFLWCPIHIFLCYSFIPSSSSFLFCPTSNKYLT